MPRPLVIDSGAAETVLPADWFTGQELRETDESQGRRFNVCAGGKKNSQLWRKNVNIVNLRLVFCEKHVVPGDGRHESPWVRLKDCCKWKQSRL